MYCALKRDKELMKIQYRAVIDLIKKSSPGKKCNLYLMVILEMINFIRLYIDTSSIYMYTWVQRY